MSVGQVSVGQMSVVQMYVGQMSVGQMSISQMPVSQMSVGLMVFDEKTRSQPFVVTLKNNLKPVLGVIEDWLDLS
jgi:hypothetical protein